MEEKKEKKLAFDDRDIDKQFEKAVKHGKEKLSKNIHTHIPKFLINPNKKNKNNDVKK